MMTVIAATTTTATTTMAMATVMVTATATATVMAMVTVAKTTTTATATAVAATVTTTMVACTDNNQLKAMIVSATVTVKAGSSRDTTTAAVEAKGSLMVVTETTMVTAMVMMEAVAMVTAMALVMVAAMTTTAPAAAVAVRTTTVAGTHINQLKSVMATARATATAGDSKTQQQWRQRGHTWSGWGGAPTSSWWQSKACNR